MAKVIIAGDAVVIKSSMALADLQTIEKYRKEALCLMGGKDNEEVVFFLTANGKQAALSGVGASFCAATRDEEAKAVMTLTIPANVTDAKEYIADTYGSGLTKLAQLEALLPEVLGSITQERTALMNTITVMQ